MPYIRSSLKNWNWGDFLQANLTTALFSSWRCSSAICLIKWSAEEKSILQLSQKLLGWSIRNIILQYYFAGLRDCCCTVHIRVQCGAWWKISRWLLHCGKPSLLYYVHHHDLSSNTSLVLVVAVVVVVEVSYSLSLYHVSKLLPLLLCRVRAFAFRMW